MTSINPITYTSNSLNIPSQKIEQISERPNINLSVEDWLKGPLGSECIDLDHNNSMMQSQSGPGNEETDIEDNSMERVDDNNEAIVFQLPNPREFDFIDTAPSTSAANNMNLVEIECKRCLARLQKTRKVRHMYDKETSTHHLKNFKCDECEEGFVQAMTLKRHKERKHSETKKLMCSICPLRFKTKDNLIAHTKTHQRTRKVKPKRQKFTCEYCQQHFVKKSNLHRHFFKNRCPQMLQLI